MTGLPFFQSVHLGTCAQAFNYLALEPGSDLLFTEVGSGASDHVICLGQWSQSKPGAHRVHQTPSSVDTTEANSKQ